MNTAINVLVGLFVLTLLGLGARPLMKAVKAAAPAPSPNDTLTYKWESLTADDTNGRVLGHLERLLFFIAVWQQAHVIVGSWLAFKVASKWNVWSNLIALPKELPAVEQIDYLIARRRWGAQTLMRFLIGTLYNLVAALVAWGTGMHALDLISMGCWVIAGNGP